MPDIAIAEANASQYSAIVFVGGWGATQYQFAFPGTYANAAYNATVYTGGILGDASNRFDDVVVAVRIRFSRRNISVLEGFHCHSIASRFRLSKFIVIPAARRWF